MVNSALLCCHPFKYCDYGNVAAVADSNRSQRAAAGTGMVARYCADWVVVCGFWSAPQRGDTLEAGSSGHTAQPRRLGRRSDQDPCYLDISGLERYATHGVITRGAEP